MASCLFLTAGDPTHPSGGSIYNRHLARALADRGIAVNWRVARSSGLLPALGDARRLGSAIAVERRDVIVIDSIALASALSLCLPRRGGPSFLRVAASPRPPVSLSPTPSQHPTPSTCHPRLVALMHYLPSHYPGYSRLRRPWWSLLEWIVLRRANLVVSMSGAARRHCLAAGARPERTVVAPPGRPEIPPTLPTERAAGGGTRFLSVANWLPAKGVHTVVAAFERLNDPSATLTLIGSQDVAPAYTGHVRRQIAASRRRDRIFAPGSVSPDDITAHYRAADVFVLASRSETFGTVVVEAMTAGLPSVASRLDSLAALIDDGTSGYLVAPGSVDALAERLARLAADTALRGAMGRAARARAERHPTWREAMGSLARLVSRIPSEP